MTTTHIQKRQALSWLGSGLAAAAALTANLVQAQGKFPIRIGYQRFTELDLAWVRGLLDERLGKLGATAEWTFSSQGHQC